MLQISSITDTGARDVNEDSVAMCQNENGLLCALADGLGGHGAGEDASRCAVEACMRVFENLSEKSGHEILASCAMAAQEAVMRMQEEQHRPHDMKTTMVLLHVKGSRACWAHVGDSRLYHFNGTRLVVHTLDHSVPQMLVAQGEIREEDIRFHEDRNRLTRVLGIEWESPRYEIAAEVALSPPSSFLLCSDGFWEYISEREIAHALRRSNTPDEWLATMRKTVVQNGRGHHMDNYSAIAVFIR